MKNNFVILIVCLIFNNATFSQWVQTPGPEGGTVKTITYSDSSIYIGCSNGGGIYKSTDSGNNWVNIGESLSQSHKDVRSIIIRNDVIYAGTFLGIVNPVMKVIAGKQFILQAQFQHYVIMIIIFSREVLLVSNIQAITDQPGSMQITD